MRFVTTKYCPFKVNYFPYGGMLIIVKKKFFKSEKKTVLAF